MTDDPYGDERLVELYDLDNPDGIDHAYFRALADDRKATKIVDLGCGTGLLTRSLATQGRQVIGIDPSRTMLDYARKQPGAEGVSWVDGDASAIDRAGDADLVISTGNTMMHISTDELPDVLAAVAGALKQGGVFSFESRNPAARAWEQWDRDATYGERDTPAGHLIEWMELVEVEGGRVVFDAHNVFENGQEVVLNNVLYFRTAEELTAALEVAGFIRIDIRAGWRGEPVTDASRLLVFRAEKSVD
jgi:SAM-dependent methyltransferase